MKCCNFGDGMWVLYDDGTMLIAANEGPGDDYYDNDPIRLGFKTAGPTNLEDAIYQTKRIELTGNISALYGCFTGFTNLESVSLCPSVKTLSGTFYDCENLKNINLDNVEAIDGSYTFSNTALEAVDLSNPDQERYPPRGAARLHPRLHKGQHLEGDDHRWQRRGWRTRPARWRLALWQRQGT